MRIYLVVSFLFLYQFLAAVPIDTSQLRIQYQEALELSEQKDLEKAETLAQEAVLALQKMKDPPLGLETGLYNILGDCALDSGHYTEAIKNYERSKALIEKKGSGADLLLADVLNKLGNYYLQIKEFGLARDYLDQALTIREKLLGKKDLKLADSYINLAICMNYFGDYDQALAFHRQALAIRRDTLAEGHPKIAQCHNNIGLSLEGKNENRQALSAYRKALQLYLHAYGANHLDVADVQLNMGNAYNSLGLMDSSINHQTAALNTWRKLLDEHHPFIAIAYNNLANAYHKSGDSQQAFQLFEKALEIRISHYGETHPDVGQSYFSMALSYSFLEQWDQALEKFRQCYTALNYTPGPQADFEQVNNPILLLQLLKLIPEIPVKAFQESASTKHLLDALNYYQQADRLIDFLRTRYQTMGSKLMLANTAHDIYDSAIEIALLLRQLNKDDKYLRLAFHFSEKTKAILLLEGLQKAEADAFSGVSPSTIDELSRLESAIGNLEKRRFLEWEKGLSTNNASVDSLNNLIFQQKGVRSKLIDKIEKNYPQYYNLRYATSTLPVELLQEELLKPQETIISYFLGRKYLQIFVINKNNFQARSVELSPKFQQSITHFNQAIRSFPNPKISATELSKLQQQYCYTANFLFKCLIQPIEDLIQEKLIIIPDEEIGFISFEALLSNIPDDLDSFKTYPYLLRDHSISYNYSSGLLKEMLERKNDQDLKPYLGFAPEFKEGNVKDLTQLKYNEEEILGVNQQIGGRILSNREATKASFINLQHAYKIIHLATHGKANSAFGDYSFLAFSETAASFGDEALLYVREIYNLTTNAEMVVLSACETGTGELQTGEGIASIARSFSYAGAKSLIATQWRVDDKPTSELMQLFFENLKLKDTKDGALREAKLRFIDSNGNKYAHPFYWASFISIGNMESISLDKMRPSLIWMLPVLLILSLIAFSIKNNKLISNKS